MAVGVLGHLELPGGGAGGLSAAAALCVALYAGYTEMSRIGRREGQILILRGKVRELMQSRRAAGLLRLQADVRRRRQDFPQPPFSSATAALARRRAGRREPLRQVDYRRLCIASLEALVADARLVTVQGGAGPSERGGKWQWLLANLSRAGPEPGRDNELYALLHMSIDNVEQRCEGDNFYCRLCLGFKGGREKSVGLKCRHRVCCGCARLLVEGAIDGFVKMPIACPVGCDGIVTPSLVDGLIETPVFERFKRLHDVKMSLAQSAPHSQNLGDALKEARAAMAQQSRSQKGVSTALVGELSPPRERRPKAPSPETKPVIFPGATMTSAEMEGLIPEDAGGDKHSKVE